MNQINTQKGFTLIELMIAIVIGLLITAAAAQIYFMGVRNASVQKAASGVLDANVFGLQQLEKNLRMAGLGLGTTSHLNKDCSGVLISSNQPKRTCADNAEVSTANPADIYVAKIEGLTGGAGVPMDMRTVANHGPSNTSNGSTPQLTIQYRAPAHMRDCEGKLALGPRDVQGYQPGEDALGKRNPMRADGQVIVERYFVQRNAQGDLELRCDAGRYVAEHIFAETITPPAGQEQAYRDAYILDTDTMVSAIKDIGAGDSLIVSGIDDFQVRFGVNHNGNMRYVTIDEYQTGTISGEIVAIRLAILAKGNSAINASDAPANPTYVMFGSNVTMEASQPTNAVRRVYETTTMLRNSRGGGL